MRTSTVSIMFPVISTRSLLHPLRPSSATVTVHGSEFQLNLSVFPPAHHASLPEHDI